MYAHKKKGSSKCAVKKVNWIEMKKNTSCNKGLWVILKVLCHCLHCKVFFCFFFEFRVISASAIKNHFKKALHSPITFFNYIKQRHRQKSSGVGSQKCRLWLPLIYWLEIFCPCPVFSSGCSWSVGRWHEKKRCLVWQRHRSAELVVSWSEPRGAGVMKPCLIGSTKAS